MKDTCLAGVEWTGMEYASNQSTPHEAHFDSCTDNYTIVHFTPQLHGVDHIL